MKYILTLLSIVCCLSVFAQPEAYKPSNGLRTSYVAVGFLPGLKVGLERPYRVVRTDYLKKNNKVRSVHKERYLVYNLGFYYQPKFHNHFMAHVDWQRTRQYPSGFFFESTLGLGVSRTYLFEDTYVQRDNGEFKKVPFAGDTYAMLTAGWAMGYNFNLLTSIPIKTYIRPGFMVFAPYNSSIYPRTTLDFVVVYKADRIWKSKYRTKVRTKDRRGKPNA